MSFVPDQREILKKLSMDEQAETPETSVEMREISLDHNIGIDSLPHKIVKQNIQQGFVLNILLIGETGIGKSTLIGSLFDIAQDASSDAHDNDSKEFLKQQTYNLQEGEINLKLTVMETVGYGDQINREENVVPIINHINSQFEKYFQEELSVERSLGHFNDTRVHVCLYFICPTGHGLKPVDRCCLKQLNDKVNVIPIIAKSDCLSREELRRYKIAIREEIEKEGIKLYRFPTDDEEVAETNRKSNDLVPFAIAASEDYAKFGESSIRVRVFPWGTMVVENDEHTDFLALKHALIEVNMEDLREKTHTELYEIYRRERMIELGFPEDENFHLREFYQKKYDEFHKEMREKEKKLKETFIKRMEEKNEEFKIKQKLLYSKYNAIFEKMKGEKRDLKKKLERIQIQEKRFQ